MYVAPGGQQGAGVGQRCQAPRPQGRLSVTRLKGSICVMPAHEMLPCCCCAKGGASLRAAAAGKNGVGCEGVKILVEGWLLRTALAQGSLRGVSCSWTARTAASLDDPVFGSRAAFYLCCKVCSRVTDWGLERRVGACVLLVTCDPNTLCCLCVNLCLSHMLCTNL